MQMNALLRLFLGLCLVFGVTSSVQAASLYIDPAFSNIYRGDEIKLAVRLDVDEATEECVNAVDGVITYSENLAPVDFSTGDSIFNIWVEQPVIDKENRTITFAGGIPNGYCGRVVGDPRLTNTIVELVFRSPGFSVGGGSVDDKAIVEFTEATTAYLNDGLGTKADLATYGAQIDLDKSAGGLVQDPWRTEVAADNVNPQEFSITLQKDTRAFSGKYFIVFNTTDKETGIDHYEVIEEPLSDMGAFNWGRANAPWLETRSPFVLRDQTLNSVIRVKAIDKAGNEYIATLIPNEDARGIPVGYFIIGAGMLLSLLLLFGIIFTSVRSWRKRKAIRKDLAEAALTDNETTT